MQLNPLRLESMDSSTEAPKAEPAADVGAAPARQIVVDDEPTFAGFGATSTAVAPAVMKGQFDRIVDAEAAPARVAAPQRTLRERLRRPLMLALPIALACVRRRLLSD